MDKAQAIHNFWSSFEIPAYDETDVPTEGEDGKPIEMPYITYSVTTDSIGGIISMSASLWYYSYSWKDISRKAEEIAERIVNMYPPSIKLDHGRLYLAKGTPFAQRMSDPEDDKIRRIYLNLQAEFLTAY